MVPRPFIAEVLLRILWKDKGMKLSEFFRNATASRTDENGESVVINQKNLNTLKLNRQIRALVPGQTLYGEVVSRKGGEVQIRLADDMVLSARLERDMAIDIGKIMTFEVRNNGKALTLSPLFANTATDANVFKALDMASLPVNETTVEMTQNMMEQGLSIDKNNIQNIYKDVTTHMDAEVRDIIQLHQLKLEVTPENLEQLKSYQSMQHQLTGAMNQITNELAGQMEQMLLSDNPMEVLVLLSKWNAVFLGENNSSITSEVIQNTDLAGKIPPMVENPDIVESQNTRVNHNIEMAINIGVNRNITENLYSELLQGLRESLHILDSEGTNAKIQNLIKNLDVGTVTISDVRDVLGKKEFEVLLKNHLKTNWLLEPEQFQDRREVEKVYQRISRQLGELQGTLSKATGMEAENVLKSVTNMQNNLDFINQLNQTFTYIQIPLQMGEKEAHGELYVYTNKRNLASNDGNISAFLHLDMEHLGPVDVYVAMKNQKVSTKFYLRDDEMIDFIQEHIHILNERLARRGYDMNCEMLIREQEEEKSILDRMTEDERNISVLSQYSFDVRA